MSLGSKNMYLTTAFFLWHFKGYPVSIIRFRTTFRGLGGITTPVATVISTLPDFRDYSVKHKTLHGANIIGQIAVATEAMSLRKNLMNLSFSVVDPGFVSALKIGFNLIRLNPQWNSIIVLDGITSLLSNVRLILKCIVDNLHSWGNRVDKTRACERVK